MVFGDTDLVWSSIPPFLPFIEKASLNEDYAPFLDSFYQVGKYLQRVIATDMTPCFLTTLIKYFGIGAPLLTKKITEEQCGRLIAWGKNAIDDILNTKFVFL